MLRRRFSASSFIDDARRFGATYANYVGKPMSYILATPPRADDSDNSLRIMYGNEAAPRDIGRFAARFGVSVVDGFGSTEGGIGIARTLTPRKAHWARCPGTGHHRHRDRRTVPAGVVGELVNLQGRASSAATTGIRMPTPNACRRRLPQRRPRLPGRRRLRLFRRAAR